MLARAQVRATDLHESALHKQASKLGIDGSTAA